MSPRPAAFLDRDGTLIEERSYPTRPDDIVLLPGVAEALSRLGAAGYLRIVLTNQSVVARGQLTEEDLAGLNEDMARKLATSGGSIDALYYCPHHPEGRAASYAFACGCRKPAPGLVRLACAEHDVDLSRSCFIGDAERDLFPDLGDVAARVLVRSGHPLSDAPAADHVARDLPAAVDWLLSRR